MTSLLGVICNFLLNCEFNMAYISDTPSLDLFPCKCERKFSHVSFGEKGQQTEPMESRLHFSVERDIYTQNDIDALCIKDKESPTCSDRVKECLGCWQKGLYEMLVGVIPIIHVIHRYNIRVNLIGDILSAISVACLHFPQGLAYGILASLSSVHGIYCSIFPVFFYSLIGTSHHMSFATDSVVAIITSEIIDTQVHSDFMVKHAGSNGTVYTHEDLLHFKVSIAAGCALLCGFVLALMGFFRLGCLATFQSTAFIGGFTTAAAFHIFTSQVAKALGINIPKIKGIAKVIYTYVHVFESINETNIASLIIALVCVLFIAFIKDIINVRYKDKLKVPVPADLIAIIISTIISHYGKFHKNFGVVIVGSMPSGFPTPQVPNIEGFLDMIVPCIVMSVLIFFLSIAMVKVLAEKHEYEIKDNKELTAYGLTNVASSFFSCFPASVSPPRNMILSSMGAKTTMNGIFTSIVMLLVLFFLGQYFADLPVPTLAAMIFVSVKPLLKQVRTLPRLYRINYYDCGVWLIACLAGILLDLPYGLLGGMGGSFLVIVLQSQRSDTSVLLCSEEKQIFLKCTAQTVQAQYSNIIAYRMCSSLYFATAEHFCKNLYALTINPLEIRNDDPDKSLTKPGENVHSVSSFRKTNNSIHSHLSTQAAHSSINDLALELHVRNKKSDTVISQASSKMFMKPLKVIIIDCSGVTYIDIQGINKLSVIFEEYRRVGVTVLLAACTPFMWKCLNRSEFFNVVSKERVFFQMQDAFYAAKILVDK